MSKSLLKIAKCTGRKWKSKIQKILLVCTGTDLIILSQLKPKLWQLWKISSALSSATSCWWPSSSSLPHVHNHRRTKRTIMTRIWIYIILLTICTACGSSGHSAQRETDLPTSSSYNGSGFIICHEPVTIYGEKPISIRFAHHSREDSLKSVISAKAQKNLIRWSSRTSFDNMADSLPAAGQ